MGARKRMKFLMEAANPYLFKLFAAYHNPNRTLKALKAQPSEIGF
jgi:hypothetical protein